MDDKMTDCMNVTDGESETQSDSESDERSDSESSVSQDCDCADCAAHTDADKEYIKAYDKDIMERRYAPYCPWCFGCTFKEPCTTRNVVAVCEGLVYWNCPKVSPCGHKHTWLKGIADRCNEPNDGSVQCLICLGQQPCSECRSDPPGRWPCFCTKWYPSGKAIPGTEYKGPICLGPVKPE